MTSEVGKIPEFRKNLMPDTYGLVTQIEGIQGFFLI